jgi:hypothetical protein
LIVGWLVAAGCLETKGTPLPRGRCIGTGDCPEGATCHRGICMRLCFTSDDCFEAERCDDGYCEEVEAAVCRDVAECRKPCFRAERCFEGQCVYVPSSCVLSGDGETHE